MSHSYRTIPYAKFELAIFSIFGDMTVQSQKGGNKSSNLYIYPLEMGLNFKKRFFMFRGVPFNPKLTPVNFSNFQAEEISPFSKCFRHLNKKVVAAP